MSDRVNPRLEAFRDFMKNSDGAPLLSLPTQKWLISNGFFTAPASTRFHGAYEGGLFDHSFAVAKHLVSLTEQCNLTWNRKCSPYLIGMFHDLCKIDQYQHPVVGEVNTFTEEVLIEDTGKWEYRKDTLLKGHGAKSVMLLSQFTELTEEEIMCIRYHMGAFTDREEWNDYTRAIHAYPNVLWTHTADMLASHVEGV